MAISNLTLPTGRMTFRRRALLRLLLLLICLPGCAGSAPAQSNGRNEKEVEAAFLPKFVRYVAWPTHTSPATGQPYQLCIIGRDPFGQTVDRTITSETIGGHAIKVRRLSSAEKATGCHLAFVDGGDYEHTQQLLIALAHQPVLTVTNDCKGKAHGMIDFLISGGRVRFTIDNATAATRGIGISSQLLALAVGVKSRP